MFDSLENWGGKIVNYFFKILETERREIKDNNDWLPKRIHNLYEKWEKEFEDFGVDRLEGSEDDKK